MKTRQFRKVSTAPSVITTEVKRAVRLLDGEPQRWEQFEVRKWDTDRVTINRVVGVFKIFDEAVRCAEMEGGVIHSIVARDCVVAASLGSSLPAHVDWGRK